MGVDVDTELHELVEYSGKYPSLKVEFSTPARNGVNGHDSALRRLARTLGLGQVHRRLDSFRDVRRIKRGQVKSGFVASGGDFGFNDALGCADFLSRVTSSVNT